MFAYCNNNPIIMVDFVGTIPHNNFLQMHTYIERPSSLYITNQNTEPCGSERLGVATVAHGGCGVIASYNALVTLNDYRPFNDVLHYYNNQMLSTPGHGLIGISPYTVARYFEDLGYSVIMSDSTEAIDLFSQTSDACIMFYMFPRTYPLFGIIPIDAFGAHFIEYHRIDKGFRGMNTTGKYGFTDFQIPSDFAYRGNRFYAVGIFIYK